jgi:hypothetical protein
MNITQISSLVLLLIGLFMVYEFGSGGLVTPPVLSGVAFILIAMRDFMKD